MPIFTSVGVAAAAAVVAGAAAVVAAAAPVVAAPPAVVADELSESSPHAAATSIERNCATHQHHSPHRHTPSGQEGGIASRSQPRNRASCALSTARCTARATSPTSASVRVRSAAWKRSAYARLRAPSPTAARGTRRTDGGRRAAGPRHHASVRSTSPAGIVSATSNARSMSLDGYRLIGRYRRSPCGRANRRSRSSSTHATRSSMP